MQTPEYKVVIIGETEVCKTTFMKRLVYNLHHLFIVRRTLGVEVMPLDLHGNNGRIRLNLWDCGGEFKGLGEKYYIDTYGAIIFRKSENDNHLVFENGLPDDVKKFYITDFDIKNPEYTIDHYKMLLYNWIMD